MTFLTTLVLAYLLLIGFSPATAVKARLRALDQLAAGRSDIDQELAMPFAQRILAPLTASLTRALTRYTPQALRQAIEKKLEMAGSFGGLNPEGFLLFSASMAVTAAGFMYLLGILVPRLAAARLLLITAGMAAGLVLPYLLLQHRIRQRQRNIQKALPDVLDLLTVSVEAGLGFDGALVKLSEKMRGALVEEFSRLLQEIRMGVPRREALHALARRTNVPDVSVFVTSLVQADQLGVSIGNVLRVQAEAMRHKRRQRARELAMQAPVKMLLPLVFFIFPPLIVVLLGPAVIRLIVNFAGR